MNDTTTAPDAGTGDVEALLTELFVHPKPAARYLLERFLASDWLAAHTAAAEARGAERGARAVVEAVEDVLDDTEWSGWDGREVFTDRLLYIVRRTALEGGA